MDMLRKELPKVAKTDEERLVAELYASGKSITEVSKETNIARSTVGFILKRLENRLLNEYLEQSTKTSTTTSRQTHPSTQPLTNNTNSPDQNTNTSTNSATTTADIAKPTDTTTPPNTNFSTTVAVGHETNTTTTPKKAVNEPGKEGDEDDIIDDMSEEEEVLNYVEIPERRVITRLRMPPEIFYKYNIWVAYVNAYGKKQWDKSFEDFLNYAVDALFYLYGIKTFAIAEVNGKQVKIG